MWANFHLGPIDTTSLHTPPSPTGFMLTDGPASPVAPHTARHPLTHADLWAPSFRSSISLLSVPTKPKPRVISRAPRCATLPTGCQILWGIR
jgi:hypothetical protein